MVGTVGPQPEALTAFRTLLRSNIRTASRFQEIFLSDEKFIGRRKDGQALNRPEWAEEKPEIGSVWDYVYDSRGRPLMERVFAMESFLFTHGDLRRGLCALDALSENIELPEEIGEEFNALRALISRAQDQNIPYVGPMDHTFSTVLESARREMLESLEGLEDVPRRNDSSIVTAEAEMVDQAAADAMLAADKASLISTELPQHVSRQEDVALHNFREMRVQHAMQRMIASSLQLRYSMDNLLATRLLAPCVHVANSSGDEQSAWNAYPWFSMRVRTGWERTNMDEADRTALDQFLRQQNVDAGTHEALGALFAQLEDFWAIGASEVKRHLEEGFGWEAAGGRVNLIPSPYLSKMCHSVLVVVSVDHQLQHRLREAHDLAIRCHDQMHTIVLISDQWDETYFNEDRRSTFETLKAAYGMRLAVLLRLGGSFKFYPVIM